MENLNRVMSKVLNYPDSISGQVRSYLHSVDVEHMNPYLLILASFIVHSLKGSNKPLDPETFSEEVERLQKKTMYQKNIFDIEMTEANEVNYITELVTYTTLVAERNGVPINY